MECKNYTGMRQPSFELEAVDQRKKELQVSAGLRRCRFAALVESM